MGWLRVAGVVGTPRNCSELVAWLTQDDCMMTIPKNMDTFDFRGTRMTVSLSTADAAGAYSVIEMIHPPNVGPALHIHPRGPESFFIIEGSYTFLRGGETVALVAGQAISIPAGTP